MNIIDNWLKESDEQILTDGIMSWDIRRKHESRCKELVGNDEIQFRKCTIGRLKESIRIIKKDIIKNTKNNGDIDDRNMMLRTLRDFEKALKKEESKLQRAKKR